MKHYGRKCPVCGQHYNAEILHHQRLVPFEDSHFPEAFDVVACADCGMVYSDVPPQQEHYDRVYREQSKYIIPSYDPETEGRRQEQTAKTIVDYLGRKDARILDVGCATGSLLAALKVQGCRNLSGMDPSIDCAQQTQNAVNCQVTVGTLSSDMRYVGRFDLVILSHVLEHIADVAGALQVVAELLADGGAAYLEVPDATRYLECLSVPFQDFNSEHINHFSSNHLFAAAERAGLILDDHGSKTFPHPAPHLYPAVFGFLRKFSPTRAIPGNGHLAEQVRLYAEASQRLWSAMEGRLLGELQGQQPIVWGTGELTLKLLAGPLGKLGVTAFVDSNPIYHGRKLMGHLVHSPQNLVSARHAWKQLYPDLDTFPIVAAGILHSGSIEAAVRKLGLPNPVITLKARAG